MIRLPAVAGQFYPASPQELERMIAGLVDKKAPKTAAVGAVSPHAGYIYSGGVAGATISRMALEGTAIIIGPSHTGMGKPLSIMTQGSWRTPLGDVEIDSELGAQILSLSSHLEEDAEAHIEEHSIEVQLPFLQYLKKDVKIVPIVLSHAPVEAYKEIGRDIARAVKAWGGGAVIIASSDMTHYEPQAAASNKDAQAIKAILALDEDELLRRVATLNISMCGYAPVTALITAAKGLGGDGGELVKYQTSGDVTGDTSAVVGYAGILIKQSPPLVSLARDAVEAYVTRGSVIPPPQETTPQMREKGGVFVSIHKGKKLRGCIGTFEPTQPSVAQETIVNAISAATNDPRFSPVEEEDLPLLSYKVDVLATPEAVAGMKDLDPARYGVIVEAGWRRGLLLPDLEGVDTAAQQVDICRRKAGIGPDEDVKLYRFEVRRYV